MMPEPLLLAVAGILLLLFYVYASFEYSVEDKRLVIRWRVMGILFNRRRIDLDRIAQIRQFEWKRDIFPGFEVWGTLFHGRGHIIVLRSGILKKLYITPRDPEGLKKKIVQLNT